VFEACGGMARLEALEYNTNETLASKAHQLLAMFSDGEEEEVIHASHSPL